MSSFPLSPVPSYYAQCSFPTRNGVFYAGGTAPSVTLSKSGATAYYVLDYWGNQVSSGSVSGTHVTPTAPSGGWTPGWYRIYFTGGSSDSLFGPSYGATNFVVIRNNSNFVTMPTVGTYGGGGGESRDLLMKGVMGVGTSRLLISDVTNLSSGDSLAGIQTDVPVAKTYWSAPGSPYADSARPRPLFTNFPNGTVDSLILPGSSGGTYLTCYAKDGTVDSSKVYVALDAGSVSGNRIRVYYPNSSTLVETYDNQASSAPAAAAINAASAYIRAFTNNASTGGTLAVTVIGNAHWTGVVTVVSTLYPDVTRFEGPSNEPGMSAELAHQMQIFQAAVHTGNSSALAIGPCPVDINPGGWEPFLAAGGGAYCDEISFHAYNAISNGDINLGRSSIEAFQALLTKYGLQSKPLWQTEATQVFTAIYGVYHPRRARVPLMQTLLWEQYGLARERNPYWYDVSHGFWDFPVWLEQGDGSLNPQCVLYRTLAEETFGQTHHQRLDFGLVGDHIFLGSVYQASGGASTVVLMVTSYMPEATVTLTVTGTTSPLTVVDGFGNLSTVNIISGRAVIPVSDIPTYVRLPTGAGVTVYTCNDWPPVNVGGQGTSSSWLAAATLSGVSSSVINDGGFMTNYGNGTGIAYSLASLPDTAALTWPTATRVDRVIIWCGPVWQVASALVDFDVQTTVDGTTWVTQTTVTKTTPSSFQHGTDSTNVGCQRETYWDEQWIFDVKLPQPVTAKGVRLYVRATSYGGEPDNASTVTGGQGDSNQHLVLEEIAVLCDNNTQTRVVRA